MNRFLCAAVLATILAACEKKHPPAGPPDSGAAPAPGRMAPPPGKGNIRPGTFIPWVEPGRSFDQWFADVRDGSRDAAWQGKFNLGQMRAEAAPRLAALLADPDPRTRIAAADAMTWMREAGAPHIEAIVRGLDDSERRVRFHAAGALKAMGSLAAPAAPAIVRHLMRGGGGNAHELSSTLVYNCGQDGEDALIAALGEDDFIGVLAAFESLDSWGRGSNDVAVSILDRALRLSPVPRIRRAAADALGVTQNDPALAAASLLHALLEDSHADVRAASARALALIARDDTTMVQPALRALGEAAADADPTVRRRALRAAQALEPAQRVRWMQERANLEEQLAVLEKRGAAGDEIERARSQLEELDIERWAQETLNAALARLHS